MNKPFSLIVEETKQELINIINKCNLHPSIVEMIIKEIYLEVNRLNTETKIKEKEQYLRNSLIESSQETIENKTILEPTEV